MFHCPSALSRQPKDIQAPPSIRAGESRQRYAMYIAASDSFGQSWPKWWTMIHTPWIWKVDWNCFLTHWLWCAYNFTYGQMIWNVHNKHTIIHHFMYIMCIYNTFINMHIYYYTAFTDEVERERERSKLKDPEICSAYLPSFVQTFFLRWLLIVSTAAAPSFLLQNVAMPRSCAVV